MLDEEVKILDSDPRLYNEDLAPIPFKKRSWGGFVL
jgi:cytosine/uracil/thiamine/allantoin permease